ncbi:hypothetical protein ACTFIU_003126 [Dictyostelium citrinum]
MFRIIKNSHKLLVNNNNNNNIKYGNLQIKNYFLTFAKKEEESDKVDLSTIFEKRMQRSKKREEPKKIFVNRAQRYKTEVSFEKQKDPSPFKTSHTNSLNDFCNQHKEEIESNLIGKSKKPMVLCFAYNGTNYYGSSYNIDINYPAIENIIEKALIRNGHIALSNIGDPKRIKYSRSSRTDKGVHSISSVISAFLLIDETTENTQFGAPQYFIDNINRYLPSDIRLISASRPSRTFRARQASTSRVYNYLVPAEHLKDIPLSYMNQILSNYIGTNSFHNYTYQRLTYLNGEKVSTKTIDDDQGIDDDDEHNSSNGDNEARIQQQQQQFEEEREKLENKENIKIDRLAERDLFRKNAVNVRNVMNFYVDKEKVVYGGREWYKFVVVGESFIMYQIRKMMGFFLSVAKGYQTETALQLSLKSPFSVSCPTSPAFPLFLNDVTFSDGCFDKILFPPIPLKQLQSQFLNSVLIPQFDKIENETNQFSEFFNQLSTHNFRLDDIDQLIILNEEFQEKIKRRKEERGKRIEENNNNNNNNTLNGNKNNYNSIYNDDDNNNNNGKKRNNYKYK